MIYYSFIVLTIIFCRHRLYINIIYLCNIYVFLLISFRVKTIVLAKSYLVTIFLGTYLVGPPKLPGTRYTLVDIIEYFITFQRVIK